MKTNSKIFLLFFTLFLCAGSTWAAEWNYNYSKVQNLQGKEFYDFLNKSNFTQQEMIEFFKHIPISKTNKELYELHEKEDLGSYYEVAPKSLPYERFDFKIGDGKEFTGPVSKQQLKDPLAEYIALPDGPVGNPSKTYKIGFATHGFNHPWCLNQVDVAQQEADRHPNVKITILDAEWDDARQARHVDTFIAQKYDGIMIWPRVAPPMGPPVERAVDAGIPVVTFVRDVGTPKVTFRVHGFYLANYAYHVTYLIDRLMKETGDVKGTLLLIRKPLGATADGLRTGGLLRGLSYFPGIKLVGSYHNNSDRPESLKQVQDALIANPKLDIIFATGAEQAMGAAQAIDMANRWNSREGGKRIILLGNDESGESLDAVKKDKIAMIGPYPPYLAGNALRVLLKHLSGEKLPQSINAPDLPSITKVKETFLGIQSASVDEWVQYAYGPKM